MSLSGEIRLLNRLNDFCDELRKLLERWENRQTVKWLSFAEPYLKSRIIVLCDVELSGKPYRLECAPLRSSQPKVGYYYPTLVIYGFNNVDAGKSYDRDQKTMLILDVHVVETVQGVIAPLVRLYDINDQGNNVGANSLYLSALNGSYHFTSLMVKREFSPGVRLLSSVYHDFAD